MHLLLLTFKPTLKKETNLIDQSHGAKSQHQPPRQRTRGSRRSIKNLPSASKIEGSARAHQRGNSNPGPLERAAKLQLRRTGSQVARETFPGSDELLKRRVGWWSPDIHRGLSPQAMNLNAYVMGLGRKQPCWGRTLNPSCKTGPETRRKSGTPGSEYLRRWPAGWW